jgi:hypothetical protein
LPSAPQKFVPGQVLVKFRPGVSSQAAAAAHISVNGDVLRTFSSVQGLQLVRVPAAMKMSTALASYRSNPAVQYAEPNYIVHSFQTPNDPLFPSMWSLLNTGQNSGTAGADIKATQAWNLSTGSSNVVIAVIDTGVDYNHPDLATNVFTGPICPGGVVCHGIDTVTGTVQSPNDPFDDNGHGTHVSGTIGALGNNAVGVTGINWNVTILPCKFLDASGAGNVGDAIKCLDFIKSLKDTQGLNIVASNNSWGGFDFSQALQDAIDRQRQSGILFIAAAGNDFSDNDARPVYPASFPLPNVIAVAATDRNDQRAFFSNTGHHSVHLGAPGQDILSTLPGASYGLDSGTSMAAPHVTGVAALLAAQDPTRDWRAIRNLLLAGGDPTPALQNTVSGRRLNAFGAMTCTNSNVSGRLFPTTEIASAATGVPVNFAVLNINCSQPAGAVQVTVSPGGQVIPLTDDGLGTDVASGDGIYSGSFTPTAPGVYTLAFSTGNTLTVQVLNNYRAANAVLNYRPINGTNLNLGDDDVAQVTSPFPITFGDGAFNQFWVSANGIVSFTGAVSSYQPLPLPTGIPFHFVSLQAPTLVAPFWDDLFPVAGSSQNVFWDVTGVAPNRELVVEWRDVRAFECFTEGDTIKFQVVFFENSSNILFNYADTVFGGSCLDHDRGNLASEGIQVTPLLGTSWGFEGQDVTDGFATLWSTSTTPVPPPPTPVITSISPAAVDAFGPPLTLTVNGSGFVPESRVALFALDRPTTFVSSTQLTAQLSASDLDPWFTGNVARSVSVQTRGINSFVHSNAVDLTINAPAPSVTSFSPASVPAGSFGFNLTISGNNFLPGAEIRWNGQQLIGGTLSPTQAVVTVTGDLIVFPGTATITVTNFPGGTSAPVGFPITVGGPAAPPAAPASYLVNQSGATRNILTTPPSPVAHRFFGWNMARTRGSDYMSQFVRPYGRLFTATSQAPSATPSVSPISSPLTLPGLGLNEPTVSGFLPSAVAIGDFNHDGHLDWVVANAGSNDLWLYLGNGDGSAQLPRIIPLTGLSPIAIAAVDLRGTGFLDLIVAEPDSLSVGVLLGNGDGTFSPETLYFAPGPPLSLTVNDFNRDGHQDVVVGMTGDNPIGAVAFFAGDGLGRILPPVTTPLLREVSPATFVLSLTSGDLNADGIPDLLVSDINDQETGTFVYLGRGDGTFKKSQNLGGILNAAIGDLNGDGCPDVVTIDGLGLAASLMGHCDGTFQLLEPLGFFGEGETGAAIALADVNGDGKLDLITSGIRFPLGGVFGQDSGSLISVSFGDGTGAFEPAHLYRAQSGMFGLAVADLNGDLHPDIVTASQDTDSVTLLINDGSGRFSGPGGTYIGYAEKGGIATNFLQGAANAPMTISAVDLNGDGKKDMVAVDQEIAFGAPWNLVVSLNDGAGNFLPDKKIAVLDGRFPFTGNLITGDFRGAGVPDIILAATDTNGVGNSNFFVYIRNLGSGNFAAPAITPISRVPGSMVVGDFNGDGKLDFAMVGGPITTFLGNGDGTFIPLASQPSGAAPQGALAGDFNGDGKLDIFIPQGNQEFLGNGDGTFQAARNAIPVPGINLSFADPAFLFAAADLNHDGRTDLIQRNAFQDDPTPVFRVYLAQPDGSFVLQNTYSPYSGQPSLPGRGNTVETLASFVADFNGDSNPDIAAFQQDLVSQESYVQFMLGNGDGTFTPTFQKFHLSHGNSTLPNFAADIDADGKADLVELDGLTSAFQVIRTTQGQPFALQFPSLPIVASSGPVRVSLAAPAASDTVLQLSASDPHITLPASVTVPAGSLTADATFSIAPGFDNSRTFSVTASDGITSSSALASVATPGAAVGFLSFAGINLFRALLPGESSGDIGYAVVSRGGYQTTVSTHCDGLPTGLSCQFGKTTLEVPPGGTAQSSLVLAATAPVPVGNYTFNVVTSDSAITQLTPVTLKVGDFSLTGPVTATGSALPNGFETFQFQVNSVNGYDRTIGLDCSGLPAGANCLGGGFPVGAPFNTAGVSIITNNVAVGDYPFLIVGNTAFTTHTIPAVLHVGGFGGATITPGSATLSVGQSATFNLSLSSVNGFTDQLTFFCGATINGVAANGINCSFNPATASFDAAGKLTTQITVTVSARPRGAKTRVSARAGFWPLPLLACVILGVFFIAAPPRRRTPAVLSCVAILTLGAVLSCGGGGGGSGVQPPPPPVPTPTPGPQNVTVQVLAESRNQSQTSPQIVATIPVTVQ